MIGNTIFREEELARRSRQEPLEDRLQLIGGVAKLRASGAESTAFTLWAGGYLQLSGPAVEERPPFIAALGVLALADIPGTKAPIVATMPTWRRRGAVEVAEVEPVVVDGA